MSSTGAEDSKRLNIILIGCGGVGTIAALVLSKSGRARVTTVLRSKYEYVKANGWDIESVDHGEIRGWNSDRVVKNVEDAVYAESDPGTPNSQKEIYDYVVLCTKQLPNLTPTPPLLAPLITPNHTTIVLIQNGIFIEQPLIQAFPSTPILSGVSMIGSSVLPPNRIAQIGADSLQIGAHYHPGVSDSISSAKLQEFVALYRDGGAAECTIAPDIQRARWSKLLWNGSFNTICALLWLDCGQIQRSEHARPLIMGIIREIAAVAAKEGFVMEEETLQYMANRSLKTSRFRPSMLLDRDNERPMEIEVILGNVVRKGVELGVECPMMGMVYELLKVVDGANQEPKKVLRTV